MQTLFDLIKRFEGLHRLGKDKLVYVYLCPAGVKTVGWGSTHFDHSRSVFTILECETMLQAEALRYLVKSLKLCPILLEGKSDARRAAVASWAYNLGEGALRSSTMRRRINEGNWEAAAKECLKWVWGGGKKLPGLIIRRAIEAKMLMSG